MTSVVFDGKLYGPGFLVFMPYPKDHLLYVRKDSSYFGDLERLLGAAGEREHAKLQEADNVLKSKSVGTPCRYWLDKLDWYDPDANNESVLIQTDCVKVNIKFSNKEDYDAAVQRLSTGKAP